MAPPNKLNSIFIDRIDGVFIWKQYQIDPSPKAGRLIVRSTLIMRIRKELNAIETVDKLLS
jgi:hypothetical protein